MKKNIYMYLFFFALLFILFQYVSAKRYFDAETHKIEKLEDRVKSYEDSLQSLQLKNFGLQYFSLENNDDALSYYDDVAIKNLPGYIADKLLETNETKGNNPLVPYAGMNGVMKINKIKVLNHKWIIADFSDGKYWGELFIRYELKKDLGVDFTLVDHLLYTKY